MVSRLEFPDLAAKNLYALRWGYNAQGSISGSVALGVGLNFGASARGEALSWAARRHRHPQRVDATSRKKCGI